MIRRDEREDMAGGKESRKETRARNKGPRAGQLEERACDSAAQLSAAGPSE